MYICNTCWYWSPTKLWKCPACGTFWSFISENDTQGWWSSSKKQKTTGKALIKSDQAEHAVKYIGVKNKELLRVFPKGIVVGGMYLLAGEPGIGKSTLLLQLLHSMNIDQHLVSYFTWEEWPQQVAERGKRITGAALDISLFHATHVEDIIATLETSAAQVILIDSIQTISSLSIDGIAGSPSQVKYCSEQLSKYTKKTGKTMIIVGHVTKDGEIAGPKYLEHIVDVVLYLEGDRYGQYRFLRIKKNRFWSTDEVAVFEMEKNWLQPAQNIHAYALNAIQHQMPGNVVTIWLDSWRPLILYLEVLVQKMRAKYPQRVTSGIDTTRLQLIIAILDKYLRTGVWLADVFVNIPGEFKGADAGLDLAVAAALRSQRTWTVLPAKTIFLGELGLTWHVLPAKLHKKRLNEMPEGWRIIDHTVLRHISDLATHL